MKHAKWIAAGGVAAVATLLWPGPPAGAATSLGGYNAQATASIVHIEVYEPTIPIPAEPQGDFSIGYSSATSESGTARATASYLWPGQTIGDGFDQLTSQPGTSYPVQVNSRFPATTKAPKTNQAQLTKGNGMSTSANSTTTKANVTGLGIHEPDTNPADGAGSGLGQIGGGLGLPAPPSLPSVPSPSTPVAVPKAPVPVPQPLAELVSVKGMTSTSEVKVADTAVTSIAHSAASEVELLGGIITLENVNVTSQIVSNGKSVTNSGKVTIGGLNLADHKIDLGKDGLTITDKKAALPDVPTSLTSQLKTLGVSFKVVPITKKNTGAEGTFRAQGMVVTINTIPLREKLDSPLNTIVAQLGKDAKTQLAPLLQLRPKLVLNIGEATNDASATPAYNAPPFPAPPAAGGGAGIPPTSGGGAAGGNAGGLGGLGGGTTGGGSTGTTAGGTTTGGGSTGTGGTSQPAALNLPALAAVPRFMILGALVLAAAIGWALQTAGGALLGGAGPCQYGLRKGVPDLRKG